MKWTNKALFGSVGLLVIVIAVGFALPRYTKVQNSTVIFAPPATVFSLLNNFRTYKKWSPWAELDLGAQYSYSGPYSGVGARMSWQSDRPAVSSGTQVIVYSKSYTTIRTHVNSETDGNSVNTFTLSASDGGTKLTWQQRSDYGFNLIARFLGVLKGNRYDIDHQRGLANLKQLAETMPHADFSTANISLVSVNPKTVLYAAGKTTTKDTDISAALKKAYSKITDFMKQNHLKEVGPRITITKRWSSRENLYSFEAAIPVNARSDITTTDDLVLGATYGGMAVRALHKGPYKLLYLTHEKLRAYISANGYTISDAPWEEYMNSPATTAPENLVTYVYYPINLSGNEG